MAELPETLKKVLDKLYNLKSEDNIIIKKITQETHDLEKATKKAIEDQKTNEENKENSENKLATFLTQKELFENNFSGLNDETFVALQDIGIDIKIGVMNELLNEKSPEYINSLNGEIQTYEDAIAELIQKQEELMSQTIEKQKEKEEEEIKQKRLISLLEQSLSTDPIERESLTVHHVKGILSSFQMFDEAELSKLSKLIMFPDEGLIDYNRNYETRKIEQQTEDIKNNEEVIAIYENSEAQPEEQEIVIEQDNNGLNNIEVEESQVPTEKNPGYVEESTEEVSDITFVDENEEIDENEREIQKIVLAIEELTGEQSKERESEDFKDNFDTSEEIISDGEDLNVYIDDENVEDHEETIEEFLINNGFDISNFEKFNQSLEEVYDLLLSVDKGLIINNYEILRSINATDIIIYKLYNNHMYLIDEELAKKITLLRTKDISEIRIVDMLKSSQNGLREPLTVLEERIKSIENLYGTLDDIKVLLLDCDIVQFEKNLSCLKDNGYELDDKDIRNYNELLSVSKHIETNSNILKDYLIGIERKNGKYALSVFWNKPKDLINSIDDLIEYNLEDLIEFDPEVLGKRTEKVLSRVKYCEEKNIPIYEEDSSTYCNYIVDYYYFQKKFKKDAQLPIIVSREDVNQNLPFIIGNQDYVEILINTLNEYYQNCEEYNKISNETPILSELQARFESMANVQMTGKNTYKIDDICISKVKFERNLSILLNHIMSNDQNIEGVENEIILTAALYNLRQEEEILKQVVGNCLGFNQEDTLGGVIL